MTLFMKILKDESGRQREGMILIAITGIIAAIAVPQVEHYFGLSKLFSFLIAILGVFGLMALIIIIPNLVRESREGKRKSIHLWNVETGAELHDIGKIGVRDLIIGKDSALSTTEFHSVQSHVLTGENILRPIEYLSFALPTVRHHHEHYDGSGYPDGLKGKEIPLGARIVGVADALDAMTTQRPYNEPIPMKKALRELESMKGKQFDPVVVDALTRFITQNFL